MSLTEPPAAHVRHTEAKAVHIGCKKTQEQAELNTVFRTFLVPVDVKALSLQSEVCSLTQVGLAAVQTTTSTQHLTFWSIRVVWAQPRLKTSKYKLFVSKTSSSCRR